MSIPDGEYDIDLSVLGDSDLGPSLAIRYGFIPDSMDQSSPLTLFHKDEICILEAHSAERAKSANGSSSQNAVPIIFEGVPQRQRPAQTGPSSVSDSFFLSFSPAEKTSGTQLKVQLRRVESTVRVNKSRNAEKWRASIKDWRNGGEISGPKPGKPSTDTPQAAKLRSPHVSSPLLKSKRGRPATKNTSALSSRHSSPAVSATPSGRRIAASKRPPAANSESKTDIISVSDFEDLETDGDEAFPVFETGGEDSKGGEKMDTSSKGQGKENRTDEQPSKEKNEGKKAKYFKSNGGHAPPQEETSDINMDDDFADLEDQLDEVLDERQAPRRLVNSDSDEDSDGGAVAGTPIVIEVGDEKKTAKTSKPHNTSSKSKPMSLRELYGGEKNDYMSSSEEE